MTPSACDLSVADQQLMLDRPEAWEYRLFAAVLRQGLSAQALVQRDYAAGISSGPRFDCPDPKDLLVWLQAHLQEIVSLSDSLETLLNVELEAAFGAPGCPGDPESIVEAARDIAGVRRRMIEWALDLRSVSTHESFRTLLRLCERYASEPIAQIAALPDALEKALDEAAANNYCGTTSLRLTINAPEGLGAEIARETERLRLTRRA